MSEKQPTAYVVCRYRIYRDDQQRVIEYGDNIPVKVFDTRREARAYEALRRSRSKKFGYSAYPVKQG